MSRLEKTKEFNRGAIQELLQNGIYLMDLAYQTATNFRADAKSLLSTYHRIPAEARYPELKETIEQLLAVTSSSHLEEFLTMKETLTQGLNKLLDDLPAYDTATSQTIKETLMMTKDCTQMVQSIRSLIPLGMEGSYDALSHALVQCRKNMEQLGGDLIQNMKDLEKALKGLELYSTIYSKDPVNLSTGNFIYQKEDISLKGPCPLTFQRFYNAINERKGSLGEGWNHNHEIYIEEDKKENRTTLILEDGREEIYHKSAEGTYIPFRFSGSTLEKTKEGYQYTTQHQTKYLFDKEGRHTRREDPNGNGITLTYEHSPSHKERKNIQEENTFPYRISRITEDTGNTLTFAYNQKGLLETLTDQTGREITFTYTTIHEKLYLHTVTGLLGRTHTYTYGNNGKLKTVTNPKNIPIVTNQYDHRGRTIKQTFPDGGEMTYQYLDKEHTLILTQQNGSRIRYLHDEQKRHTGTTYTDEAGHPASQELFEYNSKNRKTNLTDRNGNRTRYKYDSQGNITEIIDPLRQRTTFTYNELNRLTQVRQADGSTYRYEYDPNANPTRITDPLGHHQQIYYQNGLPVTIRMPDESENHISYDRKGNITAITDAGGHTMKYEYDPLNRVIKATSPGGHTTTFAYNQKGEIIQTTNGEGNVRTYEYDTLGKVTKMTDYDRSTTTCRYNPMGKPEEITDPMGNTTRLTYDLMWNLTSVTDPLGNETHCQYDHNNRLIKTTDPEGYTTRYEHDPNGNLTAILSPYRSQDRNHLRCPKPQDPDTGSRRGGHPVFL